VKERHIGIFSVESYFKFISYYKKSNKEKAKMNNNNNNKSTFFENNVNVVVFAGFTTSLDYVVRVIAVLVHFVYAAFVISLKEYRSRTMIYLHHVNAVSMLYCLHFVVYIGSRAPNFDNNTLNETLCTLSELAWMNLKLMRALSLLMLAVYRYLAVYRLTLYRRLNGSMTLLVALVPLSWLFSVSISLIFKYAFRTSYAPFFCTDGFSSESFALAMAYYALSALVAVLVPTICVYSLYKRIQRKFNSLSVRLNRKSNKIDTMFTNTINTATVVVDRQADQIVHQKTKSISKQHRSTQGAIYYIVLAAATATGSSSVTTNYQGRAKSNDVAASQSRKTLKAEFKFAKQFASINFFTIMSSLFLLLTNMQLVIASYPQYAELDKSLSVVRPLLRIAFLLAQSMIPIVCIMFNPLSSELVKKLIFSLVIRVKNSYKQLSLSTRVLS
jgi:hypothetical protein